MSDQFTEVTTEGWGSRLGGSLIAALIGIILVPASIILLYWNEGRAVDAIRALNRGAAAIVEVNADAVDAQANGKLVHLTGTMQPTTTARDPVFGVSGDGLLRLSRAVEMYQWKQQTSSHSTQSVGGTKTTETTYTYKRVWSAEPINSSEFKYPTNHQNPSMTVRSATFNGGGVMLGAYKVDPAVLDKVENFTPLPPPTGPPSGYQLVGDGFYRGQDPSQPAIGDLRVSFKQIPTQTVSVAAALAGNTLTPWRDTNGYTIAMADPGLASAQTMFHEQRQTESTITWILRGVGFVLMFIGFICMTRPLAMLAAVLPPLEWIVSAGAFLGAITLAVPLTLLTISIAWLVHRPLIGGALLVAAIVSLLALRMLHRPRARPA